MREAMLEWHVARRLLVPKLPKLTVIKKDFSTRKHKEAQRHNGTQGSTRNRDPSLCETLKLRNGRPPRGTASYAMAVAVILLILGIVAFSLIAHAAYTLDFNEDGFIFYVQPDLQSLLHFLQGNRDIMININKDMFISKTLERRANGNVVAYVSMDMSAVQIWDTINEQFYSLQSITGNANLHVTVSYQRTYDNYADLHQRSSRARSFIGGLQGDEVWGEFNLSISNDHVTLRIKETSHLYGVLREISDIVLDDHRGYHITILSWY